MALNPFEQLRNIQAEPRKAFEDIASKILQSTVQGSRRVRIHHGDGGVDVYEGRFGKSGKVDVYQIKYFPDNWQKAQRQQIRKSYRTALKSSEFALARWSLCVPARLRKEDLHWWDEWRDNQVVPIDLLDGDDLTAMLEKPECSAVVQMLGRWGVQGLHSDGPRFTVRARVRRANPRSSLSFVINPELSNEGDLTARGLRVTVKHTDTNCAPIDHDEQLWDKVPEGMFVPLNPRRLRCRHDLNPQDKVKLFPIALGKPAVFPFEISVQISAADQQPLTLFASITSAQAEAEETVALGFK